MVDSHARRDRVRALRRAGKSRREIEEELGISTNWELNRLLDGEPPPVWTSRPNAKDDLRERARQLRAEGSSYPEIAAELGVSKSSVSLWTRDVETPCLEQRVQERDAARRERLVAGRDEWLTSTRRRRGIARQPTKFESAMEVGDLSQRELFLLGAVAYWCEGAKDKSYRRQERIDFINSDPRLVQLFLRFLDVQGVGRERIQFRVHIHETADLEQANEYWAVVVGCAVTEFRKPVLKKHDPKTNRRNRADDYRGSLQIKVLQSAELYWRIEGLAFGAMVGEVQAERQSVMAGSGSTAIPRRLRPWRRPRRSSRS